MSRPVSRLVGGSPEDLAGTVFGAIVTLAVLTAGSGPDTLDAWRLAVLVTGTTVVLWLGHVYALSLGESVKRGRRLDRRELREVARRQAAIPLAAVAPIAALCLGATGLVAEETAVWVALCLGVATLGIQGLRYARLERLGRAATMVAVAVNVLIGLAIVCLKVALVH